MELNKMGKTKQEIEIWITRQNQVTSAEGDNDLK